MRPLLLNRCKTSNSRSLPCFVRKPVFVISSLWARQTLTNIQKWTLQLGRRMLPFVQRPLRPGNNTIVNIFSQLRTPPESQKHLKLNLQACSCFTGLEKCGYDTVIKKTNADTLQPLLNCQKNNFCRTISKIVQKPNF